VDFEFLRQRSDNKLLCIKVIIFTCVHVIVTVCDHKNDLLAT